MMTPKHALAVWSVACRKAGIPWFLIQETLLCAHGYGCLPEELNCGQVAVYAEHLPRLVDQVFPKLPGDWQLNKAAFFSEKRQLVFLCAGIPVLKLQVLFGAETPSQLATFTQAVESAAENSRSRLKRRTAIHRILRKLGRLYTATFGKRMEHGIQRITDSAFAETLHLCASSISNAALYSDALTSNSPCQFEGALFRQIIPLSLKDETYPVCIGYTDYLEAVYGDYKNGLYDDIGCGLDRNDKDALRQHQVRCLEALTFLRELSQEFNLRFYLLAGSVLGAVRHKGFIPWDDDIDVGIRIEDITQFEKTVKEHLPQRLPEGFQLVQSGANNPYPRMFSKICYEGRCCIDLWPLVPTYTDSLRGGFQWYFARLLAKIHNHKNGHSVNRYGTLAKFAAPLLSDRATMFLAHRNERLYANKKTPAYINLYSVYTRQKETIPRQWLDTEATAEFCGLAVPVVGCTHDYLTHLYNDYMRFPLPWNRASRHIERF